MPALHMPLVHDNVTRWQAAAILLKIDLLLIYHMFMH